MITKAEVLAICLDGMAHQEGDNPELFADSAAELRRLAAVEAELERIKALPPVAWRSSMGHGVTLKESITDEQKALTWDGKPMWQALIALGSKT